MIALTEKQKISLVDIVLSDLINTHDWVLGAKSQKEMEEAQDTFVNLAEFSKSLLGAFAHLNEFNDEWHKQFQNIVKIRIDNIKGISKDDIPEGEEGEKLKKTLDDSLKYLEDLEVELKGDEAV